MRNRSLCNIVIKIENFTLKDKFMPLPMFQNIPAKKKGEIKNIIAIAAGKGGVGKSTVTVNLAHGLKALGFSVGVMDTDIYGPSIRKMMPEDRMPSQKDEKIIPALCQGIKMISMAYFRNENEAAVVRAPIANGIIKQFIKDVDWGDLDYLLIDFPPGTGDIQLTLSQQANLKGAIVVTTPQEVALLDVRKSINMFDQVKIPIIGIVENMSYYIEPSSQEKIYIFGQGGGQRLSEETEIPFLGSIPLDPQLCKSGDTGESLFFKDKEGTTLIVQTFKGLAKQVVEHLKVSANEASESLENFEMIWKNEN